MINQLQLAISKMIHNEDERMVPHLQKELLRWGVQVNIYRTDLYAKLERQEAWLDQKNRDNPKYEERFTEWMKNLDEYTRASRLLEEAKAML